MFWWIKRWTRGISVGEPPYRGLLNSADFLTRNRKEKLRPWTCLKLQGFLLWYLSVEAHAATRAGTGSLEAGFQGVIRQTHGSTGVSWQLMDIESSYVIVWCCLKSEWNNLDKPRAMSRWADHRSWDLAQWSKCTSAACTVRAAARPVLVPRKDPTMLPWSLVS